MRFAALSLLLVACVTAPRVTQRVVLPDGLTIPSDRGPAHLDAEIVTIESPRRVRFRRLEVEILRDPRNGVTWSGISRVVDANEPARSAIEFEIFLFSRDERLVENSGRLHFLSINENASCGPPGIEVRDVTERKASFREAEDAMVVKAAAVFGDRISVDSICWSGSPIHAIPFPPFRYDFYRAQGACHPEFEDVSFESGAWHFRLRCEDERGVVVTSPGYEIIESKVLPPTGRI